MAKQQKENSEPIEFKYVKEIQFGVLALVAGLGFFKVEDLKSFIDVISQLVVSDFANKEKHDISVYLLSGIATLAYIFYFFGFGAALLTMFHNTKNFTKAILVSVASYFIMYLFLVILIFKGPYNNSSDSKNSLQKKEETPITKDSIANSSRDTASWRK